VDYQQSPGWDETPNLDQQYFSSYDDPYDSEDSDEIEFDYEYQPGETFDPAAYLNGTRKVNLIANVSFCRSLAQYC
jgi:hypothetical protein